VITSAKKVFFYGAEVAFETTGHRWATCMDKCDVFVGIITNKDEPISPGLAFYFGGARMLKRPSCLIVPAEWALEASCPEVFEGRVSLKRADNPQKVIEAIKCFVPGTYADYQSYLKSHDWAAKREVCLTAWLSRCAICCSTEGLEVHHRTYERLGHEKEGDLIPLCSKCHGKFHNKP
jgi:hypothetical protein